MMAIYPDSAESGKTSCQARLRRFCFLHDPPGFLDSESRRDLIELAGDGSAAHRLARRANALVLLDDGMSCEAISPGAVSRRRHDPDLVPALSGGRDRGSGKLRP
jgi:hypothetical protein